MSVRCECCVLSRKGVCVGFVTSPDESYRVRCVCDREATIMRRPWKWYVVKHNCVTKGIFSDYNRQLRVSACTGHLQVVLGELKILL